MFREKDVERLWFLYKTEGESKGISINSFCIINICSLDFVIAYHKSLRQKEFSYFLMPCHQHCLGVNLLVQR